MKKIISIITGTRAEYSLLKPLYEKLTRFDDFDVRLAVTGSHLSSEFGMTYKEIEEDGLIIDEKIQILSDSDTPEAITKSMGVALIEFGAYFSKLKPDIVILLGDRYEALAIASAATLLRIPIAHLHGGEITEGAIDDAFRHAITKLSYLHFTSTEAYRKRVIQLGEAPSRVYAVGALGIENIKNLSLLSKSQLEDALQFSLEKPYCVVTFHPVTLEDNQAKEQVLALLDACESRKDLAFVFTKANADTDGRLINQTIQSYVERNNHFLLVDSLGSKKFLSALKYAKMVIGNSSSGIIEAPSFSIPTINIGDRQRGRIQSKSIINCKPEKQSILEAMKLAESDAFLTTIRHTINPYGDGNTSEKIVNIIRDFLIQGKIDLKKTFFDCEEI